MTRKLARIYYKDFQTDPDLFADMEKYHPYIYSPEKSDQTVERHKRLGRVFLAVMLNGTPIGEIVLKNIDRQAKCCTMGIHLQNDSIKNQGYGTKAEILAIQYAFDKMKMQTVYADAIHKNKRSQHVLEKVGFKQTHRDDTFIYYRCDADTWNRPTGCPEAGSV